MIIPDVNLLLYAEIDGHRLHGRARRWWEEALSGERQVGLAPVCVFGFLRPLPRVACRDASPHQQMRGLARSASVDV